jgi:hypothetical protein
MERHALLTVQLDNTDVEEVTKNASHGSGNVTASLTVKINQMNLQHVHNDIAEQEHSNVKITTAHLQLPFVMATMTVETTAMNKIVTCHVLILTLSVNLVEDVFWTVGDAMVMPIVKMEVMKILQYVINVHVTQIQNSIVRMADVFQNCGCAILITIVEMILMNLPTCVVKEIVQQDGRDVQGNQIIDVFRNGSSVMERMTVETIVMNYQKIVQCAILKQTLSARTIVAFLSNGLAISLTIVEMDPMKQKLFVKANIENVQNLNSVVKMANVFHLVGDVTMRMIVEMDLMSYTAKTSNARMEHSNVNQAIVLLHTSDVMEIVIVEICQMKLDVLQNILVVDTAQKLDSNVTTISVYSILMSVTVQMIVEIIVMKHLLYALH